MYFLLHNVIYLLNNIKQYKNTFKYFLNNSEYMSNIEQIVKPVTKAKTFSFQLGWSQVKNGDLHNVRNEIMSVLGITTRGNFLRRLRGEVDPKVSEVNAIESVFKKYGINKIWGE